MVYTVTYWASRSYTLCPDDQTKRRDIMSQAKVDQHKKEKANRKKENRKEKIERAAVAVGGIVIAAAICVWIGYSIYGKTTGNTGTDADSSTVTVNTDAVDGYLDGLDTEE